MRESSAPARALLVVALAGFLCLLFFAATGYAAAASITEYRVLSQAGLDGSGKPLMVIRSLRRDGVPLYLVVDPYTVETALRPASQITLLPGAPCQTLAGTPYLSALDRDTSPPCRLQNQGATRGEGDGIFLTVDLCPSRRPFERGLFDTAASLGRGKAVPVAVAVTGVWIEHHPEEMAYLKGEVAAGRLSVTWVNHSFHHVYTPKSPLERNFLLTPGTDFDAEVLDLERLLLENGLTPSPFFRFPGLVADAAVVRRLRELSLIPIGSEAWLAKGEHPRQGSIVLVHGNGNEPKGVALVLPLLRGGRWHLLPLAAAFQGGSCPPPPHPLPPKQPTSVATGGSGNPPSNAPL